MIDRRTRDHAGALLKELAEGTITLAEFTTYYARSDDPAIARAFACAWLSQIRIRGRPPPSRTLELRRWVLFLSTDESYAWPPLTWVPRRVPRPIASAFVVGLIGAAVGYVLAVDQVLNVTGTVAATGLLPSIPVFIYLHLLRRRAERSQHAWLSAGNPAVHPFISEQSLFAHGGDETLIGCAQCPRCGYDLGGNPVPGCPECGMGRGATSSPPPTAPTPQ